MASKLLDNFGVIIIYLDLTKRVQGNRVLRINKFFYIYEFLIETGKGNSDF